MSDSAELERLSKQITEQEEDFRLFAEDEIIEVVDRRHRVITWVGPGILRIEGHA